MSFADSACLVPAQLTPLPGTVPSEYNSAGVEDEIIGRSLSQRPDADRGCRPASSSP